MEEKISDKLLTYLNTYTINNNIAELDTSAKETSVVRLDDVENRLKQIAPAEYDIMKSEHSTLFDFLKSKETSKYSKGWCYEVMTTTQYKQDLRQLNNSFLALKTSPVEDARLLVMYVESPMRSHEESLSNELLEFYKKNYLSLEHLYKTRRSIRDRVNTAIQSAFPQLDLSVQMIRSSHTELAFPDSTICMGIITPTCSIKDKDEFDLFKARYNCLSDTNKFIMCLQDIGMTDVKPCIRRKGVFMFTDSFSRQKCQIADDHGMLYEREKLIETYLNLDQRIRPLISFVLYFCQIQNIKRVDDGDKFLSTYPLIILVLNFLMSGLEYPVIPSLQKLSVDNECNIEDCLYTKNKGIVVTKRYRQYLNEMKFWYHTCVIIKHDNDNMDIQMENKTVWNSHNNDSLGALLIAFFQYYANQKNLTGGVSIFHAGKRGYINLKTPIAIQDPFLPINNISSSCKQDAMEQTIKKFDSAWKALMDEKSLQFICEYKLQLY